MLESIDIGQPALNLDSMTDFTPMWTEPDHALEIDRRVQEQNKLSSSDSEEPTKEKDETNVDSEDDRPLDVTSLPSAKTVKLPGWSSQWTKSERLTNSTQDGELNAKQAMTVQMWYVKLSELGTDSAFWERIKNLHADNIRKSVIHQFCRGGNFKHNQLSALIAFQNWAKSAIGTNHKEWYTDNTLWDYMNHLNDTKAAATRASSALAAIKSFLKAAEWIGNISNGTGGIFSYRVYSARRDNTDRKRLTEEAPPLTVAMVKALEEIVLNENENLGMRSVVGFLLFTLYTRERVADAARCRKEPWCEGGPDERGHIESRTTSEDTRHGQTEDRRRREVVLLGPARGVATKGSWGHVWLDV